MLVASGRSQKHVSSLADNIQKQLRDIDMPPLSIEGMPMCDWVLIDTGDVIVHIFKPEAREFYNIEKMWSIPIDNPTAHVVA